MKIVEMGESPNKYTKLEDYFTFVREAEPVVGIGEIENLIKTAAAHSKYASDFKNKFTFKYKFILSVSILIIVAYITSLFFNNGKKDLKNIKTVKLIEQQSHTAPKSMVTIEKNEANLLSNQNSKNYIAPISNLESLKIILPGDDISNYHFDPTLEPPFNEYQIPPYSSDPDYKSSPVENPKLPRKIKPVDLNIQQLEKLGFSFKSAEVIYQTAVKKLGHISYAVQTKGEFVVISKSKLFLKHTDYYPIFITDINCNNLENIDSVLYAPKLLKSGVTYTNYTRQFKLLPVLIKRPDHATTDAHKDLIFWFKATASLISEINGGAFIAQSIVTENRAGMLDADWTTKQNELQGQIATTINQFKPLVLSKGQMEKLGFIFGTDSLQYKCTIKGHGTINYYATRSGEYGLKSTAQLAFNGKDPDIISEFITEKSGFQDPRYSIKGWNYKDKWTDKYFLSEIRTLVPVVLKQSEFGFPKSKDMLFWFKVTPDFLAALPDTISKDMATEYKALKESGDNKVDITAPIACKYFDVCQLPLEKEYGIKIYPNPASTKFNLEFWPPKNDGTVYTTFELTDLSGKVILKSDFHWFGRTAEIPVSDVKPGIYLITYKLSTGEVITNKVMVTR